MAEAFDPARGKTRRTDETPGAHDKETEKHPSVDADGAVAAAAAVVVAAASPPLSLLRSRHHDHQ